MSRAVRFAGLRYALWTVIIATAIALVAVGAKMLIAAGAGTNAGFVIYVPAVALAAWQRGFAGGLIATAAGAIADSLIFLPPLAVHALELREEQLRLAAYVLGGLSVSVLSYRLRAARDHAQQEAGERRRALVAEAEARKRLDVMIAGERRASELRNAFNSIVSHELRTPITAIYGGAKLLARRTPELDEKTRLELTDDLAAEADRLYRLVEDLLVLARSEQGAIEMSDEPIVLPRLAERVVASEQSRWPAARFELSSDGDIAPVRGEVTYVEQVLRNLLSNAAKYSPAGSVTAVVVDEIPGGVRVRVMDEGTGIDPEEAENLFDLYYRSAATAGQAGGAGIGLFVCRSLVEAMSGRIWAAPRPGGGSEFGFTLPRYENGA